MRLTTTNCLSVCQFLSVCLSVCLSIMSVFSYLSVSPFHPLFHLSLFPSFSESLLSPPHPPIFPPVPPHPHSHTMAVITWHVTSQSILPTRQVQMTRSVRKYVTCLSYPPLVWSRGVLRDFDSFGTPYTRKRFSS